MINPFKLFKSKKPLDQIEKDVQTMNSSNWRTNVSGILVGLLMLASIWAPAKYQDEISKTQQALVMIGLLTAADAANLKKG